MTDSQFSYIEKYITQCREALLKKDFHSFETLVDIDSFIDFFVLSDFYRNTDHAGRSVYMYRKEKNGKLIFGPSWDFDYSCSRPWSLKPNTDYSLDNATDRFDGFEWWNLFLSLPEGEKLALERFHEWNLPIIEHEIKEAKRYFEAHIEEIKKDAELWYSQYVVDTDELVEANYTWFMDYLTKRIDFYKDDAFAF